MQSVRHTLYLLVQKGTLMKGLNEQEHRQLINQNRQILGNIEFDFVVTLNTRQKNQSIRTHRIHEFVRRLNQALIGTKWRDKSTPPINWLHLREEESQSHSHSAVKLHKRVDKKAFKDQARRIWHQVNQHNKQATIYFDTYSNKRRGAITRYISKGGDMDCSPV
jgi:hypothetical protein